MSMGRVPGPGSSIGGGETVAIATSLTASLDGAIGSAMIFTD
jgi:hypothetical protein